VQPGWLTALAGRRILVDVTRLLRLRVRPGTALLVASTEPDAGGSYQAGEEIVLPMSEAALLLRGKGRRGFEIVEVIDDPPVARERRLP